MQIKPTINYTETTHILDYLRRADMLLELLQTGDGVPDKLREMGAELAAMRAAWPLVEYKLPFLNDASVTGVRPSSVDMPLTLSRGGHLELWSLFPSDKPFLMRGISVKADREVLVQVFDGDSVRPSASNVGEVRDAWITYRARKPIRFALGARQGALVQEVVVSGYVLGT